MIRDTTTKPKGLVSVRFENPATGAIIPYAPRNNQLSYTSADAMALAFSGVQTKIPRYIGFIYGASATPTGLDQASGRLQTWGGLAENLAEAGIAGNIQIARLSRTPSMAVDGDSQLYTGNAVIFTAHTTTGAGTYGFTPGTPYADRLDTGSYLYQAVLLGGPVVGQQTSYWPIARVTLADGDGAYLQKPANFELVVEWQVSFF